MALLISSVCRCDISVTCVVRKDTSSIELLQLYKKNIIRAINMLFSSCGITFWPTNHICVQVSSRFVNKDGCSCLIDWTFSTSLQLLNRFCWTWHEAYCSSAWYESLSKSFKKKLQILQNKTIRFVQNLGPRASIDCKVFESVNTLCVADRVRQLRLNHVFNIVHGLAPNYLCEHFNQNNNNTRGASNLNFNVPRVGAYNSSNFYYHAILDWNALPLEAKSTTNKSGFKFLVKSHLSQEAIRRENSDFSWISRSVPFILIFWYFITF